MRFPELRWFAVECLREFVRFLRNRAVRAPAGSIISLSGIEIDSGPLHGGPEVRYSSPVGLWRQRGKVGKILKVLFNVC
jgi:hypothetical protein